MKINNQLLTILLVIQLNLVICTKRIRKRQIYREQVQPHTGGKIPRSAFETDRLLLNRLQKEGIAIPDGILLEQRNPKVFPYSNSDLRPVFKVLANNDDRFTDDVGDIFHSMQSVSETTYPIPHITEDRLEHFPIHTTVYQPIYRPFLLPNPYLHNPSLSTQEDFHAPFHKYHKHPHLSFKYFYEDYVTSQIFDDLSKFMDMGYNIDVPFGAPLR